MTKSEGTRQGDGSFVLPACRRDKRTVPLSCHVKQNFAAYVSDYDADDPKIALKIKHTYRVADLSDEIARSIGLGEEDVYLAWLIGMLHDIGRFEQVKRYGTYIDSESVDHAQLGADILFGEGRLIEKFTDDRKTDSLIETAIRQHNRFMLTEGLDDRTRMFCDILRDADKIDILRVNYETPMEEIYNTSREEFLASAVSSEVMEQVRQHITVTRDVIKTYADHLIGHIALVFGLVYPRSRELAKEQGYLDKLLSHPMKDPGAREALEEIRGIIGAG